MLRPQQNILQDVRNRYVPQPIDWASAVVPGTPGTAQEKALNTEIRNNTNKILQNGGSVPNTANQDPWYMDILHGIGAIGSTVTNQIANWTDGQTNWKDIPLAETLKNFGQGQWNAWNDGQIGFQDIPGFGGMVNAGKTNKTTTNIFDNLGWHDAPADNNGYNFFQAKQGQFDYKDLLELAGDVALDPTTYLTLGGSSAIKAGEKALQNTAENIAEKAGVQFSKKGGANAVADNVASQIMDQTLGKAGANPGINPRLYEDLAMNKYHNTMDDILNAGKSARESAQNALFNFDVPFTNITKQFGTKPDWLKVTDPLIGETQVNKAKQMIDELGINADQMPNMLNQRYGKTSLDQLSMQEFDNLMKGGLDIKQTPLRGNPTINTFSKLGEEVPFTPTFKNSKEMAQWLEPHLDNLGFSTADGWTAKSLHDMLKNDPNGRVKVLQDLIDQVGTWGTQHTQPFVTQAVKDAVDMGSNDILKIAKSRKLGDDSLSGLLDKLTSKNRVKNLEIADKIKKSAEAIGYKGDSIKEMSDTLLKHEQSLMKERPTIAKAEMPKWVKQFQKDMGGTSQVGAKAQKLSKAVNARTFGSNDQMVNRGAGTILDADAKIHGHSIQMEKDLKKLKDAMKGLNANEKRAIEYQLEGKLPDGMTIENLVRQGRVDQVATVVAQMKALYDNLGKADLKAGTIPKLRDNYHRHSIKGTDAQRNALLDKLSRDPILSKYLGRNANNRAGIERKGFETMADLDNAVEELKQTMAKPGADSKAIGDQITQLQELFHREPLQAMHDRYYQSIKSRAYKEMHDSLEKDGLIVKNGTGKPIPADKLDDYVHLDDAKMAGRLGLKTGDRVHKEVLKGMEKVNKIFTDEGMNKIVRGFESAINVWRGLVTTNVPSHHFFNLLGNVANATIAGVKPGAYLEAGKLLAGKGDRDIYQKALDYGILHQGMTQDLGMMFDKARLNKAENLVFNNPWAKTLNTGGNYGDNITRLALFVSAYKKTGSAKMASAQVRRFLFNYREMTGTDKAIRTVAPFWNWTKNNLPLQISSFMQQPRYYETFQKLRDQFNGEDNQDSAPDWAKNDYLHMAGDTFFNPRLPLQDLGKVEHTGDLLTGLMTPAMKVPIELYQNKQFFNGQPIDSTYDPSLGYDSEARNKYLLQQSGMPGKLINGAINGDLPGTFLDSLFGKAQHFDPKQVHLGNLYKERDALRSTVKRMENKGLIQKKGGK